MVRGEGVVSSTGGGCGGRTRGRVGPWGETDVVTDLVSTAGVLWVGVAEVK